MVVGFFSGSVRSFQMRQIGLSSSLTCIRTYSEQRHNKIHTIKEGHFLKSKAEGKKHHRLAVTRVKFIGSDRLRKASADEIQNSPELLEELAESYKLMATDKDAIEATKFCMQMMFDRRKNEFGS